MTSVDAVEVHSHSRLLDRAVDHAYCQDLTSSGKCGVGLEISRATPPQGRAVKWITFSAESVALLALGWSQPGPVQIQTHNLFRISRRRIIYTTGQQSVNVVYQVYHTEGQYHAFF